MGKPFQKVHNNIPDSLKTMTENTPVIVTKDDGSEYGTMTRSAPWQMCGTWVVLVDGISGAYALSRMRRAV